MVYDKIARREELILLQMGGRVCDRLIQSPVRGARGNVRSPRCPMGSRFKGRGLQPALLNRFGEPEWGRGGKPAKRKKK